MQRRKLLIFLAILAAGAALYGAGWAFMNHRVKSQVAAWADGLRAQGWRVDYAAVGIEGFPFDIHARVDRPVATAPQKAQPTLSAPVLFARFSPWEPRRIRLETPEAAHVDWRGAAPGRVTFTHATAIATAGPRGRIMAAEIVLDGAAIAMPAGASPALVTRITATAKGGGRPDAATPSHRRLALAVTAELQGLTLPDGVKPALGRTITRVALAAQVLGEPPPAPGAAAMAAWRDGGGTLELSRFTVGWGPLTADGSGTVALDRGMQPEGALTARIAGFDKTLETLVDAGIVKARHGVLLGYALNALAKTPKDGGPPVIEAPVTMQNGRLFIGPVALLPLPRIEWK
jgi:hypothetical protein